LFVALLLIIAPALVLGIWACAAMAFRALDHPMQGSLAAYDLPSPVSVEDLYCYLPEAPVADADPSPRPVPGARPSQLDPGDWFPRPDPADWLPQPDLADWSPWRDPVDWLLQADLAHWFPWHEPMDWSTRSDLTNQSPQPDPADHPMTSGVESDDLVELARLCLRDLRSESAGSRGQVRAHSAPVGPRQPLAAWNAYSH